MKRIYGATTSSTPFLLLLHSDILLHFELALDESTSFVSLLLWLKRRLFLSPQPRGMRKPSKKKLWMGASHVFPYSEFGMLCSIRILVSLVSWQCSSYAFVTSRRRLILFPLLPWGHLGIGATFESPHLAFLSQFRLRQKKEEGGSASIFSFSPWKGNRQISEVSCRFTSIYVLKQPWVHDHKK